MNDRLPRPISQYTTVDILCLQFRRASLLPAGREMSRRTAYVGPPCCWGRGGRARPFFPVALPNYKGLEWGDPRCAAAGDRAESGSSVPVPRFLAATRISPAVNRPPPDHKEEVVCVLLSSAGSVASQNASTISTGTGNRRWFFFDTDS